MARKLCGLVWMALVAASVGCTMCQAPYDYCASTIGPDGQPTGGFMTRKGSVLGGMPGVPVYQSQPKVATPPAAEGPPGPAALGQAAVDPAEATPVSATSTPTEEDPAADAR